MPLSRSKRITTRRGHPNPRFFRLSARVEAGLVQVVVALGVVLLLAQVLLNLPATRYVMSYVSRLEGMALDPGGASVTVSLTAGSPGSAASLLVNGKKVSSFAGGLVRVSVTAGDLLEVDGRALSGDGTFAVVRTTGGVVTPATGEEVVTSGGVASLGRVEFDDGTLGP